MLPHIFKIIDTQLFISQLHETIINYPLILAIRTTRQCLSAISISDSKMQSASCLFMKCKLNNFWVANCDSGNLPVVSYNSTSLWVASCELIVNLWVGSHISLNYIKSASTVYIISSLHLKQGNRNKLMWYIPIMIYNWEQPTLLKQKPTADVLVKSF